MPYTQNEKSTGLESLTDLTLTQSDLHIIGDVSDSGRAKTITQNLLEDYIANSANFITELTQNADFITEINNIAPSPLTTKGDIFTYSTVADRLPVGTNGQILSADSSQSTGLKWIDSLGGGGGTKVAINTTEVTAPSNNVETTMFTVAIPGGILSTNNAIRFKILVSDITVKDTNGSVTIKAKYGGTTFSTIVLVNTDGSNYQKAGFVEGYVIADGSTSAQKGEASFVSGTGEVENGGDNVEGLLKAGYGTSAIDSTVSQNLVITAQCLQASDAITFEAIIVEKITTATEQVKKVGVGETNDIEFHNFQIPFVETLEGGTSLWTTGGLASPNSLYSYAVLNDSTSCTLQITNNQILNFSTGASLDWTDNKMVIVQGVVRWGAVNTAKTGWGLGSAVASAQGAPNDTAAFVTDTSGNFLAHSSTGVGFTETSIASLASGTHVLRIEVDPANVTPQIRFYVDGVLVATNTTNVDIGTGISEFGVGNSSGVTGGIKTVTAPSFAVEI